MESTITALKNLETELNSAIDADPLGGLATITEVRRSVADLEQRAVKGAIRGCTWAEIGNALGVSKQAAFQRFGRQWILSEKAEMKAGGTEAKTAFGERVRRALK